MNQTKRVIASIVLALGLVIGPFVLFGAYEATVQTPVFVKFLITTLSVGFFGSLMPTVGFGYPYDKVNAVPAAIIGGVIGLLASFMYLS